MAQLAALLKAGPGVDRAAHQAATSDLNLLRKPTPAQAEAGNYRKGHVRIGGLDIAIENPAGSHRKPEWPPMQAHYGYAKQSDGADGDAVDVFVRTGTPTDWAGTVFVIDQTDGAGGFDEHKAMIGFDNRAEAVACYLSHYPADWQLGAVTAMALDDFKAWLRGGDTTGPLAKEFAAPASPEGGIAPYSIEGAAPAGPRKKKRKRVRMLPGVPLLRLIAKWNPDQPRDELGRWSGDGGGAGAPPAAPQTASISTPATNHMAALNADHLARLGPAEAVELQQIYRAAADAKPGFDASLTEIARATGGEAKLPGLKGSDRATEKILLDYRGDSKQIKDVLRATVEVKSVADAQQTLAAIRDKYEVLPSGFRNTLDPAVSPPDGYRDIKMNVRTPNGTIAEIQVNIPAMLSAKSENHVHYEERRTLEGRIQAEGRQPTGAEQARLDSLQATMKAGYDRAWRSAGG